MGKILYLDTNVYDRMLDRLTPHEVGRLVERLAARDESIVLSPVNIVEFLQVADELRRERLVFLLQTVCSEMLLAEVEALIVDYVVERTRKPLIQALRLVDQFSRSDLSLTWADLKNDRRKTFFFDGDEVRKTSRVLKSAQALVHAHFSRGGDWDEALFGTFPDLRGVRAEDFDGVIENAIQARRDDAPVKGGMDTRDHVVYLIASVFCTGLTPFPEVVDEFWNLLGVQGAQERLETALQGEFSFLLREGPLLGMAALMSWQALRKWSQGNLLDCYHIAYLPYVDTLLTCDATMLEFARCYPGSELFGKIQDGSRLIEDARRSPECN